MAASHEIQTQTEQSPDTTESQFPAEALRTPEEITQAFNLARSAVESMTSEAGFKKALAVEPAVNPRTEQHTAAYWAEFNNYSGSRIHALETYGIYDRKKEIYKPVDPLFLNALGLLSQAPLYAHSALAYYDNMRGHKGAMDTDSATQNTSATRDALKAFARTYPQANADIVHGNMLVMATKAVPLEDRAHVTNIMKQTIRKTQGALAYGQILDAAHRPYRLPNIEESAAGVDYVVDNNTKFPLYLQVEPAASRFEANTPYIVTSPQYATVFSMTRDEEFRHSFFIPEAEAAQKATRLNTVLSDVRMAA